MLRNNWAELLARLMLTCDGPYRSYLHSGFRWRKFKKKCDLYTTWVMHEIYELEISGLARFMEFFLTVDYFGTWCKKLLIMKVPGSLISAIRKAPSWKMFTNVCLILSRFSNNHLESCNKIEHHWTMRTRKRERERISSGNQPIAWAKLHALFKKLFGSITHSY